MTPPLPDDLVTFNVRGRIFQTTLTTLRNFKESMLYKMVEYEQQQGKWRMETGSTESSSHDGAFFIDRDPDHFAAILRFHDTNKYVSPTILSTDIPSEYTVITPDSLLMEAQFYNIPALEEAITLDLQTPTFRYQYVILVPNRGLPTPEDRDIMWENVGVYRYDLEEEAAKTYIHHALDGLLDNMNQYLWKWIRNLLKIANREQVDCIWTLWAAKSNGEGKNVAIILRGERKKVLSDEEKRILEDQRIEEYLEDA